MPIQPLNIRDGRTPKELLADGDNRWPPGTFHGDPHDARRPYLPPHLKGRELRKFLHALLIAEADLIPFPPARGDEPRCGGDVPCGWCGEKLYDHPADPLNPFLTIVCDRTRVKL